MAQYQNPAIQQRLVALLTTLESTEERLRQLGDDHWADWLRGDHARIARGDTNGLEHLKQAFGGVGSINDSYPPDDGDVGKALGEIYGLAAQLLADLRQLSGSAETTDVTPDSERNAAGKDGFGVQRWAARGSDLWHTHVSSRPVLDT